MEKGNDKEEMVWLINEWSAFMGEAVYEDKLKSYRS